MQRVNNMLPSAFLSKKAQQQKGKKKIERIFTYDLVILCLPITPSASIKIPWSRRMREVMGTNGLVGKIRLSSSMTGRYNERDSIIHSYKCYNFEVWQPTYTGH